MCNQVLIFTVLQLVMRGKILLLLSLKMCFLPIKPIFMQIIKRWSVISAFLKMNFKRQLGYLLFAVTNLRVSVSCFAFVFEEFKVLR